MLINLSNHPSEKWSAEQKSSAETSFGQIIDFSFPSIDPTADETYIQNLAVEYFDKIYELLKNTSSEVVVHVMGEMTFTYSLVVLLKSNNIKCVASTTKRIVEEKENGEKNVIFKFERFRKY